MKITGNEVDMSMPDLTCRILKYWLTMRSTTPLLVSWTVIASQKHSISIWPKPNNCSLHCTPPDSSSQYGQSVLAHHSGWNPVAQSDAAMRNRRYGFPATCCPSLEIIARTRKRRATDKKSPAALCLYYKFRSALIRSSRGGWLLKSPERPPAFGLIPNAAT